MSLALAAYRGGGIAAATDRAGAARAERPTAAVPIVVDGYGITRGHLRHWADVCAGRLARAQLAIAPTRARARPAELLMRLRWVGGEASEPLASR